MSSELIHYAANNGDFIRGKTTIATTPPTTTIAIDVVVDVVSVVVVSGPSVRR